jgi:5-deoxy-D-glucuronate isomerase
MADGGTAPHQTPQDDATTHVTVDADTAEMAAMENPGRRLERRRSAAPTFYPTQHRGNGPGSRLGLAIVAVVLAITVAAALIVSLQAAF